MRTLKNEGETKIHLVYFSNKNESHVRNNNGVCLELKSV